MANQRTNSQPRILVVRRSFWPYMSEATLRLVEWVKQLSAVGAQVTVLSGRPNKYWPREISIDQFRVIRLDHGTGNPLRNPRFSRNVRTWIEEHHSEFELVYFDELDEEAIHYLTSGKQTPSPLSVVRFQPAPMQNFESNDRRFTPWKSGHVLTPKAIVAACQQAQAIVVPSAAAHQQLLAFGLRHANIIRSHAMGGIVVNRDIGSRREARRLLRNTNQDLMCKMTDKLLLCPSDMSNGWNLELLIDACGPLTEIHTGLKLWILGDGPARPRLYDCVRQHGWQHSILMPGVFTDLEPMYQAADLCLLPGVNHGLEWHFPTSICSGLPAFAARGPSLAAMLDGDTSCLSFDATSSESLAQKLVNWLRHPAAVERAVAELRNKWMNQRDRLRSDCDRFLQLVENHLAQN